MPRAKRGPAPKMQQHMERISTLPKAKQKFVMELLGSVLAQQGRRATSDKGRSSSGPSFIACSK
ncbi:hypothetical protein [Rhizobacter sp. P5_C2]